MKNQQFQVGGVARPVMGEQNRVYLNNGTCDFSTERTFGPGTDKVHSIAVGDLDGDGDLDLLIGDYGAQNRVHLNNGTGTFSVAYAVGSGTDRTTSVALADTDGDGDLDAVIANEGQSAVYLNDGAGRFPGGQVRYFGSSSDAIHTLTVGDLTGDGRHDLIAPSQNYPDYAIYRPHQI